MTPADYLDISIAQQQLSVVANGQVTQVYPVSTAKNGAGQQSGSECTPLGWHRIRAKIGADAAINSVFVGRRFTGEIYQPDWSLLYPQRDWILSRILWLSGLEPGFNRFGMVDTARRYIYIHGSPDAGVLAGPASHGCIRMLNQDIIALFSQVSVDRRVFIHH